MLAIVCELAVGWHRPSISDFTGNNFLSQTTPYSYIKCNSSLDNFSTSKALLKTEPNVALEITVVISLFVITRLSPKVLRSATITGDFQSNKIHEILLVWFAKNVRLCTTIMLFQVFHLTLYHQLSHGNRECNNNNSFWNWKLPNITPYSQLYLLDGVTLYTHQPLCWCSSWYIFH